MYTYIHYILNEGFIVDLICIHSHVIYLFHGLYESLYWLKILVLWVG